MDLLALFDGTKPLKRIQVPLRSHRTMQQPMDMTMLDNQLNTSVSSIATIGTQYANEYVKEEEEKLLAAMNPMQLMDGKAANNMEEVSQGTMPVHHELQNEELTKIYQSYNFAYRPKENLTITSMESKIVSMVQTNYTVVIQGPTGCGKTTQVPQFILDSCRNKRVHCNIIVTQPRRIAAMSIAKRVCQERNWPLGTLVGFQVGMINNTSEDTRLTYCTTGVLLNKLIKAKNMLDYTHVILDEVHERDQNMDFLLLVVRKLQRSNSRAVKVILMSATFNVDKFSCYFSVPFGNKLVPAPVVVVTKSNFFKVSTHYLCQITTLGPLPEVSVDEPRASRDMMKFAIRIIRIFNSIDDGDHRYAVLIFLPGIWEIEEMHALLTHESNDSEKWDVVVLHSSITNEEQQCVFNDPPPGYRRLILATNIAESSITVPDIKYVIDFCLTKQLVTDPKTNFQCLELDWASKANCQQRAGRAGRLMDGRVYRLVPKAFYDNILMEASIPEMTRAPLENIVLSAKMLDMGEPKAILALSLDPPDLSNLERTILLLKETGALLNKDGEEVSRVDGDLTDLGRIMAALPVDIRISKLIALGQVFSVLRETTIIGASMAVKNMFSAPFQKKLKAYGAKLLWSADSSSDCMSFLTVYNTWMNMKANHRIKGDAAEKQWARTHCLQIRVLREIEALVRDITLRLRNLGITETMGQHRVVWKSDERPLIIKIVIAGAFYPNYYTRSVNIGTTDGVRVLGGLDPTKTVYLQGWPINQPGLLYAQRIKEYFQDCIDSKVASIIVSFDKSSRVYVQFRTNESREDGKTDPLEEPGGISLSVYKAVKLRNIGIPLELRLMNAAEANKRAEKLGLPGYEPQVFLPTEESADDVLVQRNDLPIRPVLPALDVSYIPLIIRRVITPGHFWAQVKDEDNAKKLRDINLLINSWEFGKLQEFNKAPGIGSLVLAPREKNGKLQYFRAVVQNVTIQNNAELLAKVLFVDYGYVDHVRVCDLLKIEDNNEIAAFPALAFECVLAGVRPSIMTTNYTGQWMEKAFDKFHKLLNGNVSLFGEIYSVVNGIVNLKLIRVDDTEQMDINAELVKSGFAETRDEDYLSRCNHELRERCADLPLRQRQHHEELQHDQGNVSDNYVEPPALEECPITIRLRGPNSPLEVGLSSLTKAGLGKRVTVDSSSVNSVVLDTNPEDPHDRLLIASSVNQSATGHSLNLRNTTLMPNIPGLTTLLCLMFTPQMELRRNSTASRYTGALCGLGYDPATENSLFPEHDLSIHFDVDITMDDLQDINRIRHWMSLGIHVDPNGESSDTAKEMAICQTRVKDVLFTLLDKRRVPVPRDTDPYFHRWCRYDESLFIPPGRIVTGKQNIFRLHNALDLDEKNDLRDEMITHIVELRELSGRHFRDPIGEVFCKLCKIPVNGVYQLRQHMSTQDHRMREKIYGPIPR